MKQKKIYVVGDAFKELTDQPNIICFKEAVRLLKAQQLNAEEVILEQGIYEAELNQINQITENYPIELKPTIISYFDNVLRCADKLTHKVKSENTLISDPLQENENSFRSLLLIDERCAELSDHVTGKHVQFMVLVEAARQMVNAVTEKYFSDTSKIYLANNLNVDFKSFVYPFRTEMLYRVNEKILKVNGNGRMSVGIDLIQLDKVVCHFKIDFSIMERKFITSIENMGIKSFMHQPELQRATAL